MRDCSVARRQMPYAVGNSILSWIAQEDRHLSGDCCSNQSRCLLDTSDSSVQLDSMLLHCFAPQIQVVEEITGRSPGHWY